MATKIGPNTGALVTTQTSLPQMPDEIFRRLASLNPDSVRALRVVSRELSRMGKDFLELNAQEIVTLCSSANFPLYNQIRLTISLFSPTERSGIALHLSIPGAIRSLGLSTADCPDRILSSEEIPRFNDAVQTLQDVNLQRAWKGFREGIGRTSPELQGVPARDTPAQEIRSWIGAHPTALPGITLLSVTHADLTCLPMEMGLCTNLHSLSLGNNSLTSLPGGIFDRMSQLRELYLNNNQLGSLPEGIFDGTNRMFMIHLEDNLLSSLPERVFDGMNELGSLYLHNNSLTSLPASLFMNDRLRVRYDLTIYSNNGDALINKYRRYFR